MTSVIELIDQLYGTVTITQVCQGSTPISYIVITNCTIPIVNDPGLTFHALYYNQKQPVGTASLHSSVPRHESQTEHTYCAGQKKEIPSLPTTHR